MKKKLRLLLTEKCNRACAGCCNKDWDLESLNEVESFAGYEEVLLTGGEPMLDPQLVATVCKDIINENPSARIYLYTAKSKRAIDLIAMLHWLDGITLTLHESYDVNGFNLLQDWLKLMPEMAYKSMRLNVFEGVDMSKSDTMGWQVKWNMKWIKNCPLPQDEEFKRLRIVDAG